MKYDRPRRKRVVISAVLVMVAVALIGLGVLMRQIYLEETAAAHTAPDNSIQLATPIPELPVGEAQTPDPTAEPTPVITPEPTPEPTPKPLPLAGLKIGIDPGHQKKMNSDKELVSPGGTEKKAKVAAGATGVSSKRPEYAINLEISMALRDRLVALGAEVKMAREVNDVDISNVERAVMMNEWGADLVLRIHCNGVDNKKVQGIGLFVRKTGEKAKESYAAAEALMPEMLAATGAKKDGIYKRDIYSGLNWSTVPSILVENGYLSNPAEDELLNDPEYQQLLAEGMANGVARYFGRTIEPEIEDDVLDDEPVESAKFAQ